MAVATSGGFSYYDNEQEYKRAFDAYQGGGAPYPVFSPESVRAGTPTAGPQGQRSNDITLGRGWDSPEAARTGTIQLPRSIAPAAQPRGQQALMDGARYTGVPVGPTAITTQGSRGQGIGDYLAGGGMSPGGGGGRVGPTASVTPNAPGGQRPFWQNYSPEELAALPPEAFAAMPNDIFVKYPQLLSKLTPELQDSRGFGADFQFANQIGQYRLRPDEVQPSGAPTYPGLQRTGVVPPRVQEGLKPLVGGKTGTSPYMVDYSKAQIRRPSAQKFYGGMNPTDRDMTLATFQAVGLNKTDVENDIRGPSQGGQRFYGIGERPRAPQVRY